MHSYLFSGASLYDIISKGTYQATTLGRNRWKKLIDRSSLQPYCNMEGFNIALTWRKARIGLVANEQNDCSSPDSFIGFGTNANRLTCGNFARHGGDNGDKTTPTTGFFFVQSIKVRSGGNSGTNQKFDMKHYVFQDF